MCFSDPFNFGAITIPAQSSKPESIETASLHIWSGFAEFLLIVSCISLLCKEVIFLTWSKPSTKNLKPRSVGILPADEWFDFNRPASWRSNITFLTDAGESFSPNFIDNFLEPTGIPSFKKSSTISLNIFRDLSFNSRILEFFFWKVKMLENFRLSFFLIVFISLS